MGDLGCRDVLASQQKFKANRALGLGTFGFESLWVSGAWCCGTILILRTIPGRGFGFNRTARRFRGLRV